MTQREDFEAWFFDEHTLESRERISNAEYCNYNVQNAWLVWQAATKAPQPVQPSQAHPQVEVLRRVAHELRFYNPAADEYKGKHVHKYWSDEITKAIAAINAKETK